MIRRDGLGRVRRDRGTSGPGRSQRRFFPAGHAWYRSESAKRVPDRVRTRVRLADGRHLKHRNLRKTCIGSWPPSLRVQGCPLTPVPSSTLQKPILSEVRSILTLRSPE